MRQEVGRFHYPADEDKNTNYNLMQLQMLFNIKAIISYNIQTRLNTTKRPLHSWSDWTLHGQHLLKQEVLDLVDPLQIHLHIHD